MRLYFRCSKKHLKTIYIVVGWLLQGSTPHRLVNFLFFISAQVTSWKTRRNLWKKGENVFLSLWNDTYGSMQLKARCCTFVTVFWQIFWTWLCLVNAPYSHDECLTVLTQFLSVRGASQPYVSWVSLQLQEAFQTGDAHHGSIGKMFVTWWNWHNCFPRHSSLHNHLWKTCHKQC